MKANADVGIAKRRWFLQEKALAYPCNSKVERAKFDSKPPLVVDRLNKLSRAVRQQQNEFNAVKFETRVMFADGTGYDREYVPLPEAVCLTLFSDDRPVLYSAHGGLRRQPVIMVVSPMGYTNHTVDIGGHGWWRHAGGGVTRVPAHATNPAIPADEHYDLLASDPRRPTTLTYSTPNERWKAERIIAWGLTMMNNASHELHPEYPEPATDQFHAPSFLVPVGMKKGYWPRLRLGEYLDNMVLQNALSGDWSLKTEHAPNVELHRAEFDGVAKGLPNGDVELCSEDGSVKTSVSIAQASAQLTQFIERTFNVKRTVCLFPVLKPGETRVIERHQALFAAVPVRDDWTLEKLKDEPSYPALPYLAVLFAGTAVDGALYVDHAMAYHTCPTVLPLLNTSAATAGLCTYNSLRVFRYRRRPLDNYAALKAAGRHHMFPEKPEDVYHTLQHVGPGVRIDLWNSSSRDHEAKRVMAFVEQERIRKANWAQDQTAQQQVKEA